MMWVRRGPRKSDYDSIHLPEIASKPYVTPETAYGLLRPWTPEHDVTDAESDVALESLMPLLSIVFGPLA
jgi:hypothetical protein